MFRLAALTVGIAAAELSWEEFKQTYDKQYNGDEVERQAAYEANLKIIADHNAKGDFQLGVNQFADLSIDEFSSQYFGMKAPAAPHRGSAHLGTHVHDGSDLPTSVDWTTQGAVTPIKDQGQCGSCWAFSTTGSMEGAWQLATGKLASMSEQQLVDCASSYGNQGCNGGMMDDGFDYAETTAIATEASYPYKGVDGTCKSVTAAAMPQGSVTGYKDVSKGETDLMSAIAVTPVSIAVEANLPAFQLYKSGVMSGLCGASLDHGILAVGYGTLSGTDYWKVKNSWGTSWGEAGYGLLKRGKGGSGECGILKQPSYPVVSAGLAAEPKQFAKGFVRQPRNAAVAVATITDEMRAAVPSKLDYSATGATSAVKDQGSCGSCWAFSATEGIESGVYMAQGTMPVLSTQQIVACDKVDGGCNGGDLPTAFDYVESAGGIDSAAHYPDTSSTWGLTGQCKSHQNVAKVTGYKYAVPPCTGGSCSSQDENGLKAALNSFGPLSVCVNANTFNSYYGGVMTSTCSGSYNSLDHCVQLVGYDTTASTPYWKVKNSWASDWGEQGFIRLPMGKNACGIADEAMYVQAVMSTTDVSV